MVTGAATGSFWFGTHRKASLKGKGDFLYIEIGVLGKPMNYTAELLLL
jgi:uncharacterized RmlC-like cupin family protein